MIDKPKMSDEEIVRLAEAERDAGVPDVQTASSAHDAEERLESEGEQPEAHPS